MALPNKNKEYTYQDYINWEEDERVEIIQGSPVMMAPPSRIHQEVCGEIFRQIGNFLEGKPCKVYPAPFAVRLFETDKESPDKVNTVVEPDISVICDHSKLDDRGCKGAPDYIVEVLSPSSQRHDRFTKFNLYQKAGVREYWLVDTANRAIQVFLLEDGVYRLIDVYSSPDVVKVNVLQGCFVELSKVFPEE